MSEVSHIGYKQEDTRWRATIVYQVTDTETRTVIHDIMELCDLQVLVEMGAIFCSIIDFNIEYMGSFETIKESMEK